MKILFAIYKTDVWLSTSSKKLISIVDDKSIIENLIVEYIIKNNLENLSNDDRSNLLYIFQTQGREDNFQIDEVILNELID